MTHSQAQTDRDSQPADLLARTIVNWFAAHRRDLPWRRPGTSPWGVLVSEVMSQQTPVARVAPRWEAWMAQWPTPADLAAAPTAEVLLAWDSLGYPRRALRLKECAQALVDRHAGEVPADEDALRALPGIGEYTAAAVASFAFGRHTAVLDVNVRRVLARVHAGLEHPQAAALSRREAAWAGQFVPENDHVAYNAGMMELGALVCTSRNPACEECPVRDWCRWLAAGRPVMAERKPTTQAWAGTDRQLRGAIMAVLRTAHAQPDPAARSVRADLFVASAADFDIDAAQALAEPVRTKLMRVRDLGTDERIQRLLDDLTADGLVTSDGGPDAAVSLPD